MAIDYQVEGSAWRDHLVVTCIRAKHSEYSPIHVKMAFSHAITMASEAAVAQIVAASFLHVQCIQVKELSKEHLLWPLLAYLWLRAVDLYVFMNIP
jgi:hypothetical protein